MKALLILALAALTGCQNYHGREADICLSRGYKPRAGFMECMFKFDAQRMGARKAAIEAAKKQEKKRDQAIKPRPRTKPAGKPNARSHHPHLR